MDNNPIGYVNEVELTGCAGTYPKVVVLPSGLPLTKVGLVITVPHFNNGEPTWVNVQFWDELAIKAKEYIEMKSDIKVTAELEISSWNDKNTGDKRCAPVFNAKAFEILSYPEISFEKDYSVAGIAETEEEIMHSQFY